MKRGGRLQVLWQGAIRRVRVLIDTMAVAEEIRGCARTAEVVAVGDAGVCHFNSRARGRGEMKKKGCAITEAAFLSKKRI